MESTIGQRIRQLREAKQLSVADFAKAAGVKPSAIYGLESDANKPSIETVGALRLAFPDLNTEWLQFGAGSMLKGDRELSQIPPQAPSDSERINSDRELVRMMTEEDIRASDPSGPPYRMRRTTRTPEEEIEYLRTELLRERQAHERTRERYEADRNQNHEREMQLIKTIGGGNFNDASADAADSNKPDVPMAAWVNPDYEEAAISKPSKVGFKFGSLS